MAARVLFLGVVAGLLLLLRVGHSVAPGGISPVDVNAPEVQQAVRAAVDHFNRASNDGFLSKVRRVLSAREQVVAGMLYYLRIKLGTTTCRKGSSNIDLERCQFHQSPPHAKTRICTFRVWDRPWMGPMQVEIRNCTTV